MNNQPNPAEQLKALFDQVDEAAKPLHLMFSGVEEASKKLSEALNAFKKAADTPEALGAKLKDFGNFYSPVKK